MAKTNTPLLSLSSSGTLAGVLTTQRRGSATLLRKKPTPTYRYTLPQAYQRWLYQDYAYLWTQQTEVTRRLYALRGSPYHLTAFQYWMKYQLTNLPDIVLGSRLDAGSTTTAIDFSRNANHGTIFGASPVDGVIQRALLFDNINDYITHPFIPAYNFDEAITLEAWVYPLGRPTGLEDIISKESAFYLTHNITGQVRFRLYGPLPAAWMYSVNAIPLNSYTHVCVTWDGANVVFYINGVADPPLPLVGTINPQTKPICYGIDRAGRPPTHDRYFNGRIDNPVVYNRALAATTALNHAERSYPS